MRKNKKMRIRIEGHVNNSNFKVKPSKKTREIEQRLSEDRAKKIQKLLIHLNIGPERIETIGFGASKLLYPFPENEKEESANRRVEIMVISIDGN